MSKVGEAEDAHDVRVLLNDREPAVARTAGRALREMARRLDRDLDVD